MSRLLSTEDIDALIARGEDSKTERKQELHYQRSKGEEAELIKDLLSLVNAHGDGAAYLLIGLEDRTDTPHDIAHLDVREPNIQQFVRERIEPTLRFSYREYVYAGVKIGVLEIPRSRTRFHLASRSILDDKSKVLLEKGQIYIRDGTSKRVVNASDFTLLRNEIDAQARLDMEKRLEPDRPDLEVSFQNGAKHVIIQARHDWLRHQAHESSLPDGYSDWRFQPTLYVKNSGTAVAKGVVITVTFPEGSSLAPDQFCNYYTWVFGFRLEIGAIYHDHEEMQLSCPQISATEEGKVYPLKWSVICEGMRQGRSGVLEVELLARGVVNLSV